MTVMLCNVKPSTCFAIAETFNSGKVNESEDVENAFDVKVENAEVSTIGDHIVVLRNLNRAKSKPLFIARTQFEIIIIK